MIEQPQDETIGTLETVHTFNDGPMPTGVSVSATGRVFVNYPRWGGGSRGGRSHGGHHSLVPASGRRRPGPGRSERADPLR